MKGSRFRLLPIVIVVSLAMLTIRLGSLWQGFATGTPVVTNAAVADAIPVSGGVIAAQAAGNNQPLTASKPMTAGMRPLSQVITMVPATAPIAPSTASSILADSPTATVQLAEVEAPPKGAIPPVPSVMSVSAVNVAEVSVDSASDQLAEATTGGAAKPKPKPKGKPNPADLTSLSVGAALASDPLRGNCGNYSDSEIDLLQKLGQRREVLDQRQTEIDQRQVLMSAAEGRIDKKIGDLHQLEASIQDLLKKADAQEMVKIEQLVKVYASMKPTDAARILNQMDMKILLTIVGSMKETKSAPILAAMDSDKARLLTEEMSRRRNTTPAAPAATNG